MNYLLSTSTLTSLEPVSHQVASGCTRGNVNRIAVAGTDDRELSSSWTAEPDSHAAEFLALALRNVGALRYIKRWEVCYDPSEVNVSEVF